MNFKYRVSGKNIERLAVIKETPYTVEYIAPGTVVDEVIRKEKKVAAFHQWYDGREEAVTAVLAKAVKAIKDAEYMLQARRDQLAETREQIKNLS